VIRSIPASRSSRARGSADPAADPARVRVDPRQRPFDDLVDAGQQTGGRPAAGPAEQHHPLGPGRHGADGRPGEQHVAGRIGPHHQHGCGASPPGRRHDQGLAVQEQVDGGAQVGGHGGCRGDLAGSGHRRRDEDAGSAGGRGGGHVPADVADDGAAVRGGAQRRGGRGDQSGGGLTAAASGRVRVRADLPDVERPEQFFDAVVDRIKLCLREVAAGQAGLVGDHAEAQSRGA
jgi:hypothetical protein